MVGTYNDITGWQEVSAAQAAAVAWLVGTLLNTYNLGVNQIYSHDVISYKTPGEGTTVYNAMIGHLYERVKDNTVPNHSRIID